MPLDPLASITDLTARGMSVQAGEEAMVATYLDVASTAVRDAAGVSISRATSTVAVEGGPGQWLTLPGAPVHEVTAVSIDGRAVTGWRLLSGRLWLAQGWGNCEPTEVEVTYTHGLVEVPADIVDLVCRMTAAAMVTYRSTEGGEGIAAEREVTAERLGDWSVSYASDGRVSTMELTQSWRDRLQARFGSSALALRSR
ncbi:hypothetical protein ACFXHD_10880 [Streptomyces hydrogenans]|uniref:hypothetical protein n=1 Tax=Streptomyces hydrogenans TaxID=1873719 RepID=UPI0036850579